MDGASSHHTPLERQPDPAARRRPAEAFAKDVMTKKMLIDATHAEETRVVVVDGTKVEEFDFESLNKRQLAGNIYLAKVTRVEPSLQAAFVDYGGNRHGFLAFSEIHPDYYQIPKADREALLAEEAALAREAEDETAREKAKPRGRSRSRKRARARRSRRQPTRRSSPRSRSPRSTRPPRRLDDLPPPSAAAGDIDIQVPDEPTAAAPEAAVPADAAVEEDEEDEDTRAEGYESVGGDDVQEERAPRKPMRQRRYKIQEVIKVRQILLVQVVKEERGNKGAALTTYLSLAGRYCVLMPNTARGGGISRKITNAADRKKLKEISSSIIVPEGAGLIIRTAGAARTKTEIKRDYEYLLRQWEQIRELTLKSIAPAPIYEEGSLIKRAIRDLYSREMDEILVDGERGYREAKDYMKMLMPSHAKNVKHYADALPLFSRFQVESYLSAMFNPVVQLKSGGYIVIDVTEALVAIDVNSGRATREASIEDTALKTNLEAAEEAARQMRLRDLAGLIVIDFIDMEDRRNNAAVEKKLKDKLKTDRARIQVGRISPVRPARDEPSAAAARDDRGDDQGLPALPRHRPGALRRQPGAGAAARGRGGGRPAALEGGADRCAGRDRQLPPQPEARAHRDDRATLRPVGPGRGRPSLISPDYKLERFKTASRIIPAAESLNLTTVAYPAEEEVERGGGARRKPSRWPRPGPRSPAATASGSGGGAVAAASPGSSRGRPWTRRPPTSRRSLPSRSRPNPSEAAAEPAPRTRSRRRSRSGERRPAPRPASRRRCPNLWPSRRPPASPSSPRSGRRPSAN